MKGLLLAIGAAAGWAEAEAKVSVGAVRWDAWYGAPPGNIGVVGRTVTMDLSPSRYHYRLPFFAQVHPYDPVSPPRSRPFSCLHSLRTSWLDRKAMGETSWCLNGAPS